ncbi:SixA phosphatase family protein [Commensalibacter oyaizuii]|uniref:Histidine phosphatase family protein n=1 Tax=Commensalibacter oyaizuii TaxID=3043873 RepID=A0ABT6Q2K1_9PROT|nr:histidine phosphatase family protein [Commensalibacter sp. TBRC 16381]MDI2090719.1 histidine phosphatase family protein [Commensalibacter sp. TBRC 16381]
MPSPTPLTLFLLRHGQANKQGTTDFERSLTPHGQQQAISQGKLLKNIASKIDVILCSAASRTQETLQFLNLNTVSSRVTVSKDLYLADTQTLLKYTHHVEQGDTVLIIGHNPGLHQFAYDLLAPTTKNNDAQHLLSISFPTCALAKIEFSCQYWFEIDFYKGRLSEYHS